MRTTIQSSDFNRNGARKTTGRVADSFALNSYQIKLEPLNVTD